MKNIVFSIKIAIILFFLNISAYAMDYTVSKNSYNSQFIIKNKTNENYFINLRNNVIQISSNSTIGITCDENSSLNPTLYNQSKTKYIGQSFDCASVILIKDI